MPGTLVEAGLADAVLPLSQIPVELHRRTLDSLQEGGMIPPADASSPHAEGATMALTMQAFQFVSDLVRAEAGDRARARQGSTSSSRASRRSPARRAFLTLDAFSSTSARRRSRARSSTRSWTRSRRTRRSSSATTIRSRALQEGHPSAADESRKRGAQAEHLVGRLRAPGRRRTASRCSSATSSRRSRAGAHPGTDLSTTVLDQAKKAAAIRSSR